MTGDLKIKLEADSATGEKRVPPDVMRILISFADHRDLCGECKEGYDRKTGDYCVTGRELMEELLRQPGVKFTKE